MHLPGCTAPRLNLGLPPVKRSLSHHPGMRVSAKVDYALRATIELAASGFTGGVLQNFGDRGLRLGMLAHHRRLVTAGDARAFALDPLTPPDLAALLR